MSTFNLPDLGEGLQEAEIVAWHVAEGDHVVVDQPLVSVETEKAVVEIPSPKAGHIARLLARPGERVKVGAPLLDLRGRPACRDRAPSSASSPSPHRRRDRSRAPPWRRSEVVRATPAVRARAKELGVDLLRRHRPAVPTARSPGPMSRRRPQASAEPGETLRGARRTMAVNMARAWREVVHATLHDEADIEGWTPQEDVTVRLIRAIVAGCAAEPSLNASFDGASLSLQPNANIDLGLAIDSPDGLFVPVLRDVGRTTRAGVAQADRRREERRQRTQPAARRTARRDHHAVQFRHHRRPACGAHHHAAAGRDPRRRPHRRVSAVRSGDGLALHRMLPLSLTFDHRAVTGGEAARFLRAVIADLEKSA